MVLKIFLVTMIIGSALSGATDYADFNRAVFNAQNYARANPSYYGKLAQCQVDDALVGSGQCSKNLNRFVYDARGNPTNVICLEPNFVPKSTVCHNQLTTNEGASAWKEAGTAMQTQKPVAALKWSEGLSQACYDHINDIGPKGITGHGGSDGSTPSERANRYTKNSGSGENLSFSDIINGEDVLLQLIVDDGVANRGHRSNVFSPEFTHAGVSCGCHKDYTEMCCIAYGINVQEKNADKIADVAPQLTKCSTYNTWTKGDTSGNFDLSLGFGANGDQGAVYKIPPGQSTNGKTNSNSNTNVNVNNMNTNTNVNVNNVNTNMNVNTNNVNTNTNVNVNNVNTNTNMNVNQNNGGMPPININLQPGQYVEWSYEWYTTDNTGGNNQMAPPPSNGFGDMFPGMDGPYAGGNDFGMLDQQQAGYSYEYSYNYEWSTSG